MLKLMKHEFRKMSTVLLILLAVLASLAAFAVLAAGCALLAPRE